MNAKATEQGSNVFALLESPALARVKDDVVGFLQFNYSWYDDDKAKERLLGWAHPELRNLLKYDSVHVFVGGAFRCTPKRFHQFVTLMMYDLLTELFVPVFFTSATNKTQDLYAKMFKCIEFSLGRQNNPIDVVCDFEAPLIAAIQGQFPSTPPDKIEVQGIAWVKTKIGARLDDKNLTAAALPSIDDIEDSDSEYCDDSGNRGSGDDADSLTPDGDLGMIIGEGEFASRARDVAAEGAIKVRMEAVGGGTCKIGISILMKRIFEEGSGMLSSKLLDETICCVYGELYSLRIVVSKVSS
ncbi:unnamed protein product [Phytophthora fragariaefolia]|uniref:Unnamed protein product n=1 Tax=Phytophthora fragariaefolia TaxID=1490495 RepID=A0A9W7DBJ3_9STRA|nr:unnamed protein product [Phytophthora fragariaefolia]